MANQVKGFFLQVYSVPQYIEMEICWHVDEYNYFHSYDGAESLEPGGHSGFLAYAPMNLSKNNGGIMGSSHPDHVP